jgi:hypothetical protein
VPDQLPRQRGQPFGVAIGPAVFDDQVLAIDPSEIAQRAQERVERLLHRRARGLTQVADAIDARLLREGPRYAS